MFITEEYLNKHPSHVFVFGDNLLRKGYGGAAKLRDHPQTYGFVTQKGLSGLDKDYYTSNEYRIKYKEEIKLLRKEIKDHPDYIYLISKVGAGLANKFRIFEFVIKPQMQKDLKKFSNVRFLWD